MKQKYFLILTIIYVSEVTSSTTAQDAATITWQSNYADSPNKVLVAEGVFGKNVMTVKKTEQEARSYVHEISINGSDAQIFGKGEVPRYKNLVLSPNKKLVAIQVNDFVKNNARSGKYSKIKIFNYNEKNSAWMVDDVLDSEKLTGNNQPAGVLAGLTNSGDKILFRTVPSLSDDKSIWKSAGWSIWSNDGTNISQNLGSDVNFGCAQSSLVEWKVSHDEQSRGSAIAKVGTKSISWTTSPGDGSRLIVDGHKVAMRVSWPFSFHYSSVISTDEATILASIISDDASGQGLYSHLLISVWSDSANEYQLRECFKRVDLPANINSISDLGSILLPSKNLLIRVSYGDKISPGVYDPTQGHAFSREEWGIWSQDEKNLYAGVPNSLIKNNKKK